MNVRIRAVLIGVGMVFALIFSVAQSAGTASNTVPVTKADVVIHANTLNDGKPTQCNGISPTNLVMGTSSTVNGSSDGDLLLGGIGAKSLKGGGGDDCIVGSNTTTAIDGGGGTDVCIARVGTKFTSCATTIVR